MASNTTATLVIPAPGWEQLSAEQCISAFLSLCFSIVTPVTEQRTGTSGGVEMCGWSSGLE